MKYYILPLIFILSVPYLFSNGKNEPVTSDKPAPITLNLIYLEGDVTVNGNEAELGQMIPAGAIITTKINSYCEIIFAEKNIIRIQENTISTLNVGQGLGKIEMEKGSIAFLLEKLDALGLEKDFEVTTPLTTAGIRGTSFFIKVESPDSVYFCNCNGIIDLKDSKGGNKQILTSEQHKATRYIKTSNNISHSTAALLYHDNNKMDELAAKINHKITWGTVGSGSSY